MQSAVNVSTFGCGKGLQPSKDFVTWLCVSSPVMFLYNSKGIELPLASAPKKTRIGL